MIVADIKDKSCNASLIKQLEELLESARKGDIRSMIHIVGWDDDSVTHGWVLDRRNTKRRMLAEVVLLQHDYVVNLGFSEGDSVLSQAFEID